METVATIKIGDHVTIKEVERAHIESVIKTARTLGDAADILGVDQATVYRKRKEWGTVIPQKRGRPRTVNRLAAIAPVPEPTPVPEPEPEPVSPPPPPPEPLPPPPKAVMPPSVERVQADSLTFPATPPEGMPATLHNQGIISLFRIMTRLLEPRHNDKTGLLHVDERTLTIVQTLDTYEWRNPRADEPALRGFLSLLVPMPGMLQFRGWDIVLNNELPSGNFQMFINGKRLVGRLV